MTSGQQPVNMNDILDAAGTYPNPFSGQPYSPAYKESAKFWMNFPVYKRGAEIYQGLLENQVILLTVGTGGGKSRLTPMFALKTLNYQGRVLVTMPKKSNVEQAATTGTKWFEAGPVGENIGMQYRGAPAGSKRDTTRLIFSTDGSVVQQLFNDPALSQFNYLIIDEVHERSVNIDLILLLAKKALRLNPALKLVLMSATIDPKLFTDYYSKEFKYRHIDIGGETMYPIEVFYLDAPLANAANDYKEAAITRIVDIIKSGKMGDILFFVASPQDTKKTCIALHERVVKEKIREPFCIEVYGGMSRASETYLTDPERFMINTQGKFDRRVAIATNVAEAGITVKKFVYVIESGFSNQSGYDPLRCESSLLTKRISKQSVIQRRGRVGRTEAGICFSLYTKEEYVGFPDRTTTEINQSDLTDNLLKFMIIPDVVDIKSLYEILNKMIEPPASQTIASGIKNLSAIGAIALDTDNKGTIMNGRISSLGKLLLRLRKLEPRFALALLKSISYGTESDVGIISVLMSEMEYNKGLTTYFSPPTMYKKEDPKEKALFEKGQAMRKRVKHPLGDIFALKKLYDLYVIYRRNHSDQDVRRWCAESFLNFEELNKVNRRYRETADELAKIKAELANQIPLAKRYSKEEYNIIHPLMEGLFMNLARHVAKDEPRYKNCFPAQATVADLHKQSFINGTLNEYIVYVALHRGAFGSNYVMNTAVPKEVLANFETDKLKLVK